MAQAKGKSSTIQTVARTLTLGRGQGRSFLMVALLVSLGTAASLFEPWIYRAIVDDVAGVFVAPAPMVKAEHAIEELGLAFRHVPHSSQRIFKAPLQRMRAEETGRRQLPARTPHQAMATVLIGALLLLVTRLLSELFRYHGDNRSTTLASRIERDFILRTFRHVLRLPLDFFGRRASGAVARQIDQSDHVAPVFTAFAQEIWPDVFTLIAILVIITSLNATLALITFIAVPVYAFVTWQMTRRLETRLEEYYSLWDDVSSRIQQAVAGIKTVLTHGAAEHEAKALEEVSGRAFDTYIERNRLQNRYAFAQEAIITVSKAAALLLGGIKALQHQLTPGDVVLFLAYLDQVYAPIGNLTELYTSLQEHASSMRRAHRLLDEPEVPGEERPPLAPGGGAIEFADVRFGYRPQRPVLDGVSFRVRAGERVGLVGPSGAGKTTLTDLLIGLYQPQAGTILVDGQRLTDVAPSSLRGAIRGVAADGMLFRMTIAENIRYGRFDASDAEIMDTARMAGLGPLLERLPEGLATPIGERGVELSMGERQRVLLARAFIGRPLILLLDEATANLDFKTEAAVKEAINVISEGRTTLVVAHRRSMLSDVDRVLVLRGGRVEQDGSPAELLRVDGYYRQMMTAEDGAGEGPARGRG
jgi:ABC-type multidrug transport system fused ATPase/permease subunit